MAFADHFSRQSRAYTRFRPRYPAELFEYLASLPTAQELAWDCGTGSGQAAVGLAAHFSRVVASDPSTNQVAHCLPYARVEYLIAVAEACPLRSHTADLITVAQALHWFDREMFYGEVRRIGRAGSVLAAWSYPLAEIAPAIDRIVERLYGEITGAYWPPERRLIEQRYQTIAFPFDEIQPPDLAMTAEWSLDDLLGYLGTWSSVQRYIERRGTDPIALVEAELRRAWGPADTTRVVRWPLYLRVGRIASTVS